MMLAPGGLNSVLPLMNYIRKSSSFHARGHEIIFLNLFFTWKNRYGEISYDKQSYYNKSPVFVSSH